MYRVRIVSFACEVVKCHGWHYSTSQPNVMYSLFMVLISHSVVGKYLLDTFPCLVSPSPEPFSLHRFHLTLAAGSKNLWVHIIWGGYGGCHCFTGFVSEVVAAILGFKYRWVMAFESCSWRIFLGALRFLPTFMSTLVLSFYISWYLPYTCSSWGKGTLCHGISFFALWAIEEARLLLNYLESFYPSKETDQL